MLGHKVDEVAAASRMPLSFNFGPTTLIEIAVYKKHESEKKRQYVERVMEIEQGMFAPLVFTTTGGMADEYVKYHSRLTELIINKKG